MSPNNPSLHPRSAGSPFFVLRPAVVGLMIYALLLWVAHVWALTTLTRPELEALCTDGLLGPITLPMVLGCVHVGWLLLMVRELRASRGAPVGLDRAHAAGALMGIVIAAVLVALAVWVGLLFVT